MASQSPQSMASLGRLPPELKAQIVRDLYETILDGGDALSPKKFSYFLQIHDDLFPDVPRDKAERNALVEKYLDALKAGGGDAMFSSSRKGEAGDGDEDDDAWEDETEGEERGAAAASSGISMFDELTRAKDMCYDVMSDDFTSLHNLALVNREFAELAYPWIWRELDFEGVRTQGILELYKEILPRHGQHVRMLAYSQDESVLFFASGPSETWHERELAMIIEIERLAGVVEEKAPPRQVRARRARVLMVAKVVEMCPNIEVIDCEAFQKHPIPSEAYEDDPTVIEEESIYRTDHALEAIKTHLGPRLTDISLLMNDDGISTEGDVATLLEACPNLLRLELSIYCGYVDPQERRALHEALLKLRKLETLDVSAGWFINEEFARLALGQDLREDEGTEVALVRRAHTTPNPFPALRCLALVECSDLSFEAFFNLVHRFSSTLRILDIDSTPHANHPEMTKKYLGRPLDLPRLETLVLSTPHEAKFLESFVNCKLVEFCLGFCPAFVYKDIEDFISLHQTTLKKVEVADDAALSEAQFESLEVFCHAKGIGIELLEPDSEDEEDDELDPSDFDEDEEGMFYDDDSDDDDGF